MRSITQAEAIKNRILLLRDRSNLHHDILFAAVQLGSSVVAI